MTWRLKRVAKTQVASRLAHQPNAKEKEKKKKKKASLFFPPLARALSRSFPPPSPVSSLASSLARSLLCSLFFAIDSSSSVSYLQNWRRLLLISF
jgi:hypothetical protein